MAEEDAPTKEDAGPEGPDLTQGIALAAFPENGMLAGHVGEDEVLLVRQGADIFALSAHCTHYHGPLADGLVVDGTIRCPWHHACFDLRSGEALRAPAFEPLACWKVEQRDGLVFVREQLPKPKSKSSGTPKAQKNRDRGRRRGRFCRCRNAAPPGFSGRHHHGQ